MGAGLTVLAIALILTKAIRVQTGQRGAEGGQVKSVSPHCSIKDMETPLCVLTGSTPTVNVTGTTTSSIVCK